MFEFLISKFFSTKKAPSTPPDDPLWNVLEAMEPRNTQERLRQLNLDSEQYTIVKAFFVGTLSPDEQPGVADWCDLEGVSSTGISAMTRALQLVLSSDGVNYVFAADRLVAEVPKLIDSESLTVIVNHMGGAALIISSLNEFLADNRIDDYSLEVLTPSKLRRRATGKPDFARDPLDRGVIQSVTIEVRADEHQRLLKPFDLEELVDAINRELGYDLSSEGLIVEGGPINQLGLFTCIAQIDSITQKKIRFWLVPTV